MPANRALWKKEIKGLHLPNCQTNLVTVLQEMLPFFWHFLNTTAYHTSNISHCLSCSQDTVYIIWNSKKVLVCSSQAWWYPVHPFWKLGQWRAGQQQQSKLCCHEDQKLRQVGWHFLLGNWPCCHVWKKDPGPAKYF